MTASSAAIDGLKQTRPDWAPWLDVLDEIRRECGDPDWARMVPSCSPQRGVPLLGGAAITLQAAVVRRLLQRLLRLASRCGTDAMRSLASVPATDLDAVALFTSSLRHDTGAAGALAPGGADPEALQAVVALLPVPFLQACNRRLAASVPASWAEGFCPVCGAWPAFVEIRGIERSRHCRCGRCGGEWHARALACPFCGMNDHQQLATLVPEKSEAHAVIDACNACRGYVKAFTRLQGCPAGAVMIEDLASVDLDMAALEHGYARRADAGCPLDVTVASAAGGRRLFGWAR